MVESANPVSGIWNASESLPPRVAKLRAEYFDFENRTFHNEVIPFGTGKPWDAVYIPHAWGIVPEVIQFIPAFEDSLLAAAKIVPLDDPFWAMPLVLRRAHFFAKVVSDYLPVEILDGELIFGGQFNTALSHSWTVTERAGFDLGEKKYLKKLKALNEVGIGNCGATSGHLIPDYKTPLKIGLAAMIEDLEAKKEKASTKDHKDFLEAMQVTLRAAIRLSKRYSEKLAQMAKVEADPVRAAELTQMSAISDQVPEKAPRTFHEALQSLWMVHMLIMTQESYPGPGLSPGRVDQYLYPFYKADIDAGRLTQEQATELVLCWFIKFNYAYDYQGRVGNNQGITAGFGQLITLGGINADGSDASNELTHLMLNAIGMVNMLEPKPNVRLHEKTPDVLLNKVCELVSTAQGAPFLLNFDENSIAGLRWQGLPEEQLWDYAPVGCLENTLQGNDRSGTVDVNVNLAKAVELACFNGQDKKTGKKVGLKTGDPRTFKTFDQFYDAVKKQTRHVLLELMEANNISDQLRAQYSPTPYLSAFVQGCADSGKDVTAAGAQHNFMTIEGIAFATAADSILAVKYLIYDTQKVTWDEMLKALEDNFEGHAKIQALAKNKAPKYGNDDDEADALAQDFSRFWTEEIFKHETPTGKRYRAGYLSWNYWIAYAPATWATPDGRPNGQYLSNGICATNGADRCGPTAAIRSVGKVGMQTAPNGGSHTISLSPSLLRDQEHIDKLASMLRAYGKEGGTALQINVVDADTLRKAQANPDDYRNLLVRVTGYNAYFTAIGKELQDELIARAEHQL
jgi:pyruvate formate-lyase/glycerol dehydratase family glycyl radical enzyme